jgi:hypothetical protein
MECIEGQNHNLVVVSWAVTPTSRTARELVCSNCLKKFDLNAVQPEPPAMVVVEGELLQ